MEENMAELNSNLIDFIDQYSQNDDKIYQAIVLNGLLNREYLIFVIPFVISILFAAILSEDTYYGINSSDMVVGIFFTTLLLTFGLFLAIVSYRSDLNISDREIYYHKLASGIEEVHSSPSGSLDDFIDVKEKIEKNNFRLSHPKRDQEFIQVVDTLESSSNELSKDEVSEMLEFLEQFIEEIMIVEQTHLEDYISNISNQQERSGLIGYFSVIFNAVSTSVSSEKALIIISIVLFFIAISVAVFISANIGLILLGGLTLIQTVILVSRSGGN